MRTAILGALLCQVVAANVEAAEPVDLDWLAGAWCNVEGNSTSEEHWLPARGGLMLGVNRSVSPSGTAFEFLRIEISATGARFLGQPGGKPAVAFPMIASGANHVTFANPQHDFPRRIHYSRDGDSLMARVDDGTQAPKQSIEYRWTKCVSSGARQAQRIFQMPSERIGAANTSVDFSRVFDIP